jgi:hypothetical protein
MTTGDWIGIPGIDPIRLAGLLRQIPNVVLSPLRAMACGMTEPVATAIAIGGFLSKKTAGVLIRELQHHPIGSQIFVPTKIQAEGITYMEDYVIAVPEYYFGSHAVLAIRIQFPIPRRVFNLMTAMSLPRYGPIDSTPKINRSRPMTAGGSRTAAMIGSSRMHR